MDTTKKFLYINPDNTSGEFDSSKCYPVSSLHGIQEQNATSIRLAFADRGQADDTMIDITIDSGKGEAFIKDLVEAINFAKTSFINVADASDETSFSPDIDFSSDPTITVGS